MNKPTSVPARHNPAALRNKRPRLTADTVVDYLDWITANLSRMPKGEIETHLRAAELVVRTLATEAQGKATQHTLVEQGIMDAPTTS